MCLDRGRIQTCSVARSSLCKAADKSDPFLNTVAPTNFSWAEEIQTSSRVETSLLEQTIPYGWRIRVPPTALNGLVELRLR